MKVNLFRVLLALSGYVLAVALVAESFNGDLVGLVLTLAWGIAAAVNVWVSLPLKPQQTPWIFWMLLGLLAPFILVIVLIDYWRGSIYPWLRRKLRG